MIGIPETLLMTFFDGQERICPAKSVQNCNFKFDKKPNCGICVLGRNATNLVAEQLPNTEPWRLSTSQILSGKTGDTNFSLLIKDGIITFEYFLERKTL